MAFVAGHFHFLTQFIRFYSLFLDNTISWILLSKKIFLADFSYFRNSFYIAHALFLLQLMVLDSGSLLKLLLRLRYHF